MRTDLNGLVGLLREACNDIEGPDDGPGVSPSRRRLDAFKSAAFIRYLADMLEE